MKHGRCTQVPHTSAAAAQEVRLKPMDVETKVVDVLRDFLFGVELLAAVRELLARRAAQSERDHNAHFNLPIPRLLVSREKLRIKIRRIVLVEHLRQQPRHQHQQRKPRPHPHPWPKAGHVRSLRLRSSPTYQRHTGPPYVSDRGPKPAGDAARA